MTSTNWGDTSTNSTNYTDTSVNSGNYSDTTTNSTNFTDTATLSTDYQGIVAMILTGDTTVTAGSTAYDARGLPTGTNLTYSSDWSTT